MIIAQRRLRAIYRAHSRQLLAAHEEERITVARELHDDVVQRLALLSQELDALAGETTELMPSQHQNLSDIRGELDTVTEDLREIAHGLHPAMIDQAGLGAALTQLVDDFIRAHGLEVHLVLPPVQATVEPEKAVALYRIAQEALLNVVRHSGTLRATLALRHEQGGLGLEIRDEGLGFVDSKRGGRQGIGLLGIEERARSVGGNAVIQSRPGEGTTVRVHLPMENGPR